MAHKAVARPLVVAAVALWMAACLSGARAQPSAGTVPLLQSLVDLESVEVSMGELVPALPQEALAPAVRGKGLDRHFAMHATLQVPLRWPTSMSHRAALLADDTGRGAAAGQSSEGEGRGTVSRASSFC